MFIKRELVLFCVRENSYAFSVKLADASRFIFGTKSDEHVLICSVVQFPIFHHINSRWIQEKLALMFQTAKLTSKPITQDHKVFLYDYILLRV